MEIRHDWTRGEIRTIFNSPLPELIFQAQTIHREFHKPDEMQLCRLLSIKTGACPEDCAYCSQSAHYKTGVTRQKLMEPDAVLESAKRAKADGATRFCMGAAWRDVPEGKEFDSVLEMVREVAALNLEVCCTLGMLTETQASALKEAGLTAYNHNLDTSPEFYGHIITTRVYEDRLQTIAHVRKAGITVCCGGILGIGESEEDRIGLLHQLSNWNPHPESVPINVLARVEGTPLANAAELDPMIMVRAIATARILMPASRVRLSGGRHKLSREAVALCFLAGANSIFTGEKLLTTPNPSVDKDMELLEELGMKAMQRG
ncbi:MAG TPA: biotin synthase BioB [Candidatus Dormibacteraeota bacterium]|nr:biotin synthase BioB [Candidatus Dormibacteraeota bacterium]